MRAGRRGFGRGWPGAVLAVVVLALACGVDRKWGRERGRELESSGREQVNSSYAAIVAGMEHAGDPAVVAIGLRRTFCEERLVPRCTGTLIAERVVLTAAHCVLDPRLGRDLEVMTGADVAAATGHYRVSEVVIHPDYRGDGDRADLAVLVLDTPVSGDIEPLALGAMDGTLLGSEVVMIGFGETSPNGAGIGQKRIGTAVITAVDEDAFRVEASPSMSCHGDSGGPVLAVEPESGTRAVLGVISRGDPGCAVYGLNVRVDRFADFIEPWLASLPMPAEAGAEIAEHQVCTAAPCAGDTDCPDGLLCRLGPDLVSRCAIPGLTPGDLGEPCTADSQCEQGCVRLQPGSSLGACRCYQACAEAPSPHESSGCNVGISAHTKDTWYLLVLAVMLSLWWRAKKSSYPAR